MNKNDLNNATNDARELDADALDAVNGGTLPQKGKLYGPKKPFSKREWYEQQQQQQSNDAN